MSTLDNSPITVGAKVFDLVHAWGEVTRVGTNTFTVAFGQHQVAFSFSGIAQGAGRRTLYWHDPIVIAPPKDATTWGKQRHVLATVATHFSEQ
jgi:hypothetical protein